MTKRTAAARQPATENEALAGLLGIWNRHGMHGFAPNLRGPGASAIMLATRKGWLWDSGTATFLTLKGVQALGEFLGRDLVEEQRAEAIRECAEIAVGYPHTAQRVLEAAE